MAEEAMMKLMVYEYDQVIYPSDIMKMRKSTEIQKELFELYLERELVTDELKNLEAFKNIISSTQIVPEL